MLCALGLGTALFVGCSKVEPVITQHHEPPAPAVIPDYEGPLIEVVKADVQSQEWKDALSMLANQKYAQRNNYSIGRVTKTRGLDQSPVLLNATKLKKLTPEYDGGDGMYFKAQDGDFFIWEHIPGSNSQVGLDVPLIIGHPQAGGLVFKTTYPKAGVINVIGDIVVHPCPENRISKVQFFIDTPGDMAVKSFYIGTTTAGGNLSQLHKLDADGQSKVIALPPGQYRYLINGFSRKGDAYGSFNVEEGKANEIKFKMISKNEIKKLD